jgi:hypothetical protein
VTKVPAAGIIRGNTSPCPEREGDGLCLAKTFTGAASGSITASTGLIVAYRPKDVLGEDGHKLRVSQCTVLDFIDIPRLIRKGCATNADLRRADLRRADLYGADLHEADLRRANLSLANLRESNLSGANLYGAILRGADLRGANLRRANLHGADLRGAFLRGANLRRANLRRANLRRANLRGAYLSWVDTWANLSGAIRAEGFGS